MHEADAAAERFGKACHQVVEPAIVVPVAVAIADEEAAHSRPERGIHLGERRGQVVLPLARGDGAYEEDADLVVGQSQRAQGGGAIPARGRGRDLTRLQAVVDDGERLARVQVAPGGGALASATKTIR